MKKTAIQVNSWETALEAAHQALARNKGRAARLRAAIRLFSEKIASDEPWPLNKRKSRKKLGQPLT